MKLCIVLLFCLIAAPVAAAQSTSAPAVAPRVQQVCPGVWRVRLGEPEALTPVHFRYAPIRTDGFADLAGVDQPPIDTDQISLATTARGCSVTLPLQSSERIYGFGINSKLFEMTSDKTGESHPGRHVFLRPTDSPENDLNDSHAPVPFYLSTRGYGVLVDTARYASFYTGDTQPASLADNSAALTGSIATTVDELYRARELAHRSMLVDVPAAHGVDVYLFAGPAMLDAARRYVLFSGGGIVPPMWGLGILYRGYADLTAADTLAMAKSFRDAHLPMDGWGLEPGWQSHAYSCTFEWDRNKFVDPDAFVHAMRDMGYHINAWQHCFTHPSSPIFQSLRPYAGNYLVWNGLVPDFAIPQARSIFVAQQEKSLFSKGVDGVKLDECDNQPSSPFPWSFPEVSQFPSGLDGEQMHSLLGVLYQQTLSDALRAKNLRTWNLSRNSQALASPLPFGIYSDSYNDRCYVRNLAKQGFSGLLTVPELHSGKSLEELYRRVEVLMFAPQSLMNIWFMRLPPWQQLDSKKSIAGEVMPSSPQATDTVRKLFEMRMSFIPYLYASYNDYARRGVPPIRALVMDWPADKNTYAIDDQFMVGQSLLVAPLFTGEKHRGVYLPAGEWYDYWTHEKITGGTSIDVTKPVDQIPLYVKANTMLPLAAPLPRVADDAVFETTINVFGDHPAPFTLYDDDGVTCDYAAGQQNAITVTWDAATGGHSAISGGYHGPSRYKIISFNSVDSNQGNAHAN